MFYMEKVALNLYFLTLKKRKKKGTAASAVIFIIFYV